MKNFTIKPYESTDYDQWNAFISRAKNATFLFHRDFMEYHSDRFDDFSLMIFDNEKLAAVLPANRVGNEVFSHQGLTYGGLVYSDKIKLASVIDIFKAVLFFLNKNEVKAIQIKMMPSIYHNKPAEELNYVLFLAEASLIRRDSLSVIDLTQENTYSEIRKRGIKKAILNQLEIKEVNEFDDFWNTILIPNLSKKHNAKPVHNLEEIAKLRQLFPENIRQFNVYQDDMIIGGTTVFESKNVAHCQYISVNESKDNLGGLDFLYHSLITDIFAGKHYFDFGISNEAQGRKLNEGLSYWKESFGAGTVVHDFYEVLTANFSKLENVLL